MLGDNFAGSRIGALNVTRDGINVMDQRINLGVNSVVFESVDTVDEVRVVTSPVDAELGPGSGQVQILTRSGTNNFHGSIFEQHRNTVLNANNWFNNMNGIPRDALILNQFGGRLGGPIVRNRSFFHFSYEGWRQRTADVINAVTYTPTARQGRFRFFPGVENGNANASVATVDLFGNPIRPAGATGDIQSVNLFGRDPDRAGFDPTGTVQKFLQMMPAPNNFRRRWPEHGRVSMAATRDRRPESVQPSTGSQFQRHRETHLLVHQGGAGASERFHGANLPSLPGGTLNANTKFYSLTLSSTLSPSLRK